MRNIFACLAALLLAGCYESAGMLLDPTKAVQPIKSAQDWKYTSGEDRYHARITPRADGWYEFEQAEIDSDGSDGSWDKQSALLNFLRKEKGNDIYVVATWDGTEDAYMYGLVVMRPDGSWQSVIPNCDRFTARGAWADSDLAAARAAMAGNSFRNFGCYFRTKASLFLAMNILVNDKSFWNRVGGGQS